MAVWRRPGSAERAEKKAQQKAKSADGTMSLMEHLHELRRRLFIAVLGLFIGVVVGFIWFTVRIPAIGLPSLGEILKAPYCHVPSPPRVVINGDPGGCSFLATTAFSGLQIRLKSAVMAGAVLSSPVWLLQLWGFVTPALYSKEKKYARIFVGSAALLMAAGASLAYWVIHEALTVLLGFAGDVADAALDPNAYYSFLIALLLIFGISFLLPLLLIMLNIVGVVSGKKLAEVRRYAMFGLIVFAGLTVPGNDPLTMLALAIALCLLYEVAVQVSKIHDKRKAKRLAAEGLGDLSGLSDDEASPMPVAAGSVRASGELTGAGEPGPAASGIQPEAIEPPTAVPAPEPTPPPSIRSRSDRDDFDDAT